ncbi:P-loop NTPase fold protein [Chenggangzhangella methanolivorans]|uniref:KAP NTPase domain-containing protein n=1 Tax=Chenggangzhangella methanolivorans TaxID=1437009 RepID=A0A9E6RC71_9HYPH|nr:P-loop NTPase fold protein [Chenggangzhangella methanolivorans]QZO00538.1 hypothetical protein K6K41_02060 [Chenggangzhangella methanolivorans]
MPPLGTQDVRAYLFLLFIENSAIEVKKKEELRATISKRLGESWQGKRVDRAFLKEVLKSCPSELESQLDLADRIAPLMTSASNIAGNPRLIKRFLNTLSIRRSIAKAQGISFDDAAMAKMLLFERAGGPQGLCAAARRDQQQRTWQAGVACDAGEGGAQGLRGTQAREGMGRAVRARVADACA